MQEGGWRLWREPGARPDKLHSSPGLVKLAALNSTVLVPPSRSLSLAPHFIPIEPPRSHSHQLLSLSYFISPVFFSYTSFELSHFLYSYSKICFVLFLPIVTLHLFLSNTHTHTISVILPNDLPRFKDLSYYYSYKCQAKIKSQHSLIVLK